MLMRLISMLHLGAFFGDVRLQFYCGLGEGRVLLRRACAPSPSRICGLPWWVDVSLRTEHCANVQGMGLRGEDVFLAMEGNWIAM